MNTKKQYLRSKQKTKPQAWKIHKRNNWLIIKNLILVIFKNQNKVFFPQINKKNMTTNSVGQV